jgi:hypothetical protein
VNRWHLTQRLRSHALEARRWAWVERAHQIGVLLAGGIITDRHAERLMAELGECP